MQVNDEMINKAEPLLKFKLRDILSVSDVYTLSMLMAYTLLAFIYYLELDNSSDLILFNILIAVCVISVSTLTVIKVNAGRLFILFRHLYVIPIIFVIYGETQYFIRVVNPVLYDNILILWDRAVFGVNPTEWLYQYTFPALTEFLQFSYITFFLLPIVIGVELHFRRNDRDFNEFKCIILFSFYISYLFYFIMPAIGPRFTIHIFEFMGKEMPGLFLTDFLREIINTGDSIPAGTPDPVSVVSRNCMPSGHAMISLLNIILACRYRVKVRWIIYIFGTSLIIATVYLRYHYVVDILASVALVLLVLLFEPRIRKLFGKHGFVRD